MTIERRVTRLETRLSKRVAYWRCDPPTEEEKQRLAEKRIRQMTERLVAQGPDTEYGRWVVQTFQTYSQDASSPLGSTIQRAKLLVEERGIDVDRVETQEC